MRFIDAMVLTVSEVAKILRCSKAHLCNIVNGKLPNLPPLPVLRIGRRVLIRQDALDDWMVLLEAHEREARMIEGVYPVRRAR
jgi:excisionase family DNA binding protein